MNVSNLWMSWLTAETALSTTFCLFASQPGERKVNT